VTGNVACRAVQPAGKDCIVIERRSLPGEDDEHGLRDFLRELRITHPSQCRRVNEIGMARNQRSESAFGLVGNVLPDQIHVVDCHFNYSCTSEGEKVTENNLFLSDTNRFRIGGHPCTRCLALPHFSP